MNYYRSANQRNPPSCLHDYINLCDPTTKLTLAQQTHPMAS